MEQPCICISPASGLMRLGVEPCLGIFGLCAGTAQTLMSCALAAAGVRTESQATSGLTTANGTILGVDGVPVALKGVIWHGFDNGNTMLSGLDMGSTSLSR